jgi:hypothetical protein
MVEEQLISLIGNYGFPIVVTLWFMIRTEKIIGKNTEAINSMSNILIKLCENKKWKM